MAIVDIVVPQMGEGLREVLILRLLKEPGETVARDQVIYAMETDKADMDVECPYGGVLEKWLVAEGDVVAVGAPVARLRTEAAVPSAGPSAAAAPARPVPPAATEAAAPAPKRRPDKVLIPPRTRAHGRQLGLSHEQLALIPAAGSTLLPRDVDRYLAASEAPAAEPAPQPAAPQSAAPPPPEDYEDHPLPPRQRVFNFRLVRSAALVVPATMVRHLSWPSFSAAVEASRRRHPQTACSDFEVFAYAVVRSARDHQRFRSTLISKDTVRRYRHVNLGIAVQSLGDELVTAAVTAADRLDFPDFVALTQERVRAALTGQDQVDASVQLLLSYVSAHEITDAVPVLVAPASAVVFLGAPHGPAGAEAANLGVTFDHRLINGVGAADFLKAVVAQVEQLARPETTVQEGATGSGETVAEELRTVSGDELRGRLASLVAEQAAALLELPASGIAIEEPLRNLGLNSRMALDLTRRLTERLGISLSATLLWAYPTLETLTSHLAQRLAAPDENSGKTTKPPKPAAQVAADSLLDSIDQLSEEEAESLLASKLRQQE